AFDLNDIGVPAQHRNRRDHQPNCRSFELLPDQALRNPGHEERNPRCPQQESGHRKHRRQYFINWVTASAVTKHEQNRNEAERDICKKKVRMKYDLYIQQQRKGCQKGDPAGDEHLQHEICCQDKACMEKKEEQLQPSAYDHWVACPEYHLRSGRQQRLKRRILNGLYLARLMEQAIAFALSY